MAASVRVLHCVVCDDIRREANGKEIIIGVYSGGMRLRIIPGVAYIAVWLEVIWQGTGNLKIEIRVVDPKGTVSGHADGIAEAIQPGTTTTLGFSAFAVKVDYEGTYFIEWRPGTGSWQRLRDFPVARGAT